MKLRIALLLAAVPSVMCNPCESFGGLVGYTDDDTWDVCCPATCGECGGLNCWRFPGKGPNCCGGTILANEDECSDSVSPPCKIPSSEPPPRDDRCDAYGGFAAGTGQDFDVCCN